MSVKMRLARAGSKKRPYYPIVVANSRSPRDGRFIEKIGTYNPMVAADHPERLKINDERAKHWLSVGAEPTDRVNRFLQLKGLVENQAPRLNPTKAQPKKKAQERLKTAAQAAEQSQQS